MPDKSSFHRICFHSQLPYARFSWALLVVSIVSCTSGDILGAKLSDISNHLMQTELPDPEKISELPEDGGPEFNRLIFESSPYLLQHARNPIDWRAWNEEALELANIEDKPIFLSIGYTTCHWCHVMERESFEDPEVAQLLNEHYMYQGRPGREARSRQCIYVGHSNDDRSGWLAHDHHHVSSKSSLFCRHVFSQIFDARPASSFCPNLDR